jgi:hypothetical protein
MQSDDQADTHGPRLILPSCPLNLGKGAPGDTLTGHITLRNAGQEELRITKVVPGCGCASLKLAKESIPPGEEADLMVGAILKVDGQVLKFRIVIHSNDPTSPVTNFQVQAEAPAVLLTDPLELNFGDIPIGGTPLKAVTILTPDRNPWPRDKHLKISTVYGFTEVTIPTIPKADPGREFAVHIRPRARLAAGSFTDILSIGPANSNRVVNVVVRGYVQAPVMVSPGVVGFNMPADSRTPVKRHVLVRRTDGKILGPLVRSDVPEGFQVCDTTADATSVTRTIRSVCITCTAGKANNPESWLSLWFGDDKDPVRVRIVGFAAPKEKSAATAVPAWL